VMGTEIDVLHVGSIWIPALVTATMIAISRPLWTTWLFRRLGEEKDFARETGLRLGQASEFALVIAATALANGHLSESAAQLVQLATVASMLISSYIVIFRCPTPLGVRPGLQRD
jgi:Kef-type K+ transport system membrane component KefB